MCVDVSDLPAVRQAVESLQPIHLLVNNAGMTILQHFLEVTPDAYDRCGHRFSIPCLILGECRELRANVSKLNAVVINLV